MVRTRPYTPNRAWILLSLAPLLGLAGCADAPSEVATPTARADAPALFAVAESLAWEGRSAEAADRYLALRDSLARARDPELQWRAQFGWADALLNLGHQDSAAAALEGALALAAGEPSREGWTRNSISLLLRRQGRTEAALAEAGRALDLAQAAGDKQLEASVHGRLGGILSNSGRNLEAMAANERGLALHRELGSGPNSMVDALNNLAIDYRHMGRFGDALRLYTEALELARGMGNPIQTAMVLYNLANVHSALGDDEQALLLFTESLQHAEEVGDPRGLGFLHGALAELYTRAANGAAARRHLDRALEINDASGHVYGQVLSLQNLGRLELAEDRHERAAAVLEDALAMADAAGFGKERSTIRAALARAVLEADAASALRRADAAVAIADSLGDPAVQFEALEARGAALEAAGRGAAALDAYLEAIDLLESWRGRLSIGDMRMGVVEPRMAPFEGAVRLLTAMHRPADAFDVTERARARLLREIMMERDATGAAPSRDAELRRELRARFTARTAVRDPSARTALDQEIARLLPDLADLEAETRRADPAAGALRYPAPASADEVQADLARPGRALLAFFWGDQDVYGWWITGEQVRGARLGPADSLAALVDFLRSAIEDPASGERWIPAARHAFSALVAPLGPTSEDEVLVLPDGPLAYLPVEALIPGGEARPWGFERRFVYGPSASVLLALQQAPPPDRWNRGLLAVGNPVARSRGGRGASSARAEPLAPLPYAAREARSIHRLFRGAGADLLLARRATADRWLNLDPGRYRYLHFAAHAQVSDRRPEQTHLVLAEGRLDLATIRRLQLTAELVTLSACETALGRRVRGEGIIGLPHAFLAAGARGTLVTLWRIDDRAAAEFMTEFYREIRAGQGPAKALRAVRRAQFLAGGPAAHPSRWAPFVLVGGLPAG